MSKGIGYFDFEDLAFFVIPLLLLLTNNKGLNLNLKLDKDVESKSELIENIKPYFSFQEQVILNKVQDIISIIDKINKIKDSNYQSKSMGFTQNISGVEKREIILKEISKHLEGKSKIMADALIETTQRVKKTKENIDTHKSIVKSQIPSKTNQVLSLVNCLEPIMPQQGKKRMRKMEQILNLIKKPEDEF